MRWVLRERPARGEGGGDAEFDAWLSDTWEAAAAAVEKMVDLPAGREALLARSGLLQERPAELWPPAGMTRKVMWRRRRLALRLAGCAAAALAAGAVALATVGVPGAGHSRAGVPLVNAAYVLGRVDSALSAAAPAAMAQLTVTTRGPDGTTAAEEWSYGSQWRVVTNSPAGHPAYDDGLSVGVRTLVSYQARAWARRDVSGRMAVPAPGPCGSGGTGIPVLFQPELPGADFSAHLLPATVVGELRAALSCGILAVAGRQRVDGINAIKLTSRPGSAIPETIWVNPGTYLPVRVVDGSWLGGQVLQQTADIAWLRPTAQNLARLTVPIPRTFRQLPVGLILRLLRRR
jgi:hypothetical protein